MQTGVLVKVSGGYEVLHTSFLAYDLLEQRVVTLLYHALQVGHLSIAQRHVQNLELGLHVIRISLYIHCLMCLDFGLEPAATLTDSSGKNFI